MNQEISGKATTRPGWATKIIFVEDVIPLLCNAHARRRFEATTKTTKKKGLAHHAMVVYAKLYNIERKLKIKTFYEIKAIREEKTIPIFKDFKLWLLDKKPLLPPKSPIAKSINYTVRHWNGLTRFCEDGR